MSGTTKEHEFVVVLCGSSAATFRQATHIQVDQLQSSVGPVRAMYTPRWLSRSDGVELPGDLWIEVIGVGPSLEASLVPFKGYEGATIERDGKKYKFVDYRYNTIHGLFGEIHYQRAYYVGAGKEAGSCIPFDERLGIEKRHTPGFNYFLSSFTGREAYQESLNRFHEIFRPDGKHLVSMRKALDMDYELGRRIEQKRQKEIKEVFDRRLPMEVQREIEGTLAVSIDATQVREK